jgi:hypothetical protein
MAGTHTSVVSKPQISTSLSEEVYESNGPETMICAHVGGANCIKKTADLIYRLGLQVLVI